MENIYVTKSHLSGNIQPPSSKSHSIRALLFSSLASGKSKIRNLLDSPDLKAMENAVKLIGADVSYEKGYITVKGVNGKPIIKINELFVENSGQVLRFLPAILCQQDKEILIHGDGSANTRPMKEMIDAINSLGGTCASKNKNDLAPFTVKGPITKNNIQLEGKDSQFVSAFLMAMPFYDKNTCINVKSPGERPWIDLTLSWLDKMSIQYTRMGYEEYHIQGKQSISAFDYTVPCDFSSLAYPLVAALITESAITIDNLDFESYQGDQKVIPILQRMGAKLNIENRKLEVSPSKLRGMEVDLNDCIDAVPIMAVAGCFASGTTTLTNIGVARTKESDRLRCITFELKKMGANIEEGDDYLVIQNSKLGGAEVDSHHDHRIALALAVAGLNTTETTIVTNTECIKKSYPTFVQDFKSINANIRK